MTKKVEVQSKRYVFTYAEFWHTSCCLLELAKENAKGSTHQIRASLVFTAFSYEAYLNHVGPKIFKTWEALERLSPQQKTDVLAEKIGIEINYGKMPFQIVSVLFKFRNDIAHGQSTTRKKTDIIPLEKYYEYCPKTKTGWENFCTLANAKEARVQIEKAVNIFHKASGIEGEHPFVRGITISGGTVIE